MTGVQSHFNHLSPTDIAYPPHAWFDAALARQVALAILHERYAVPKKRLAAELERGRQSIKDAIERIEERRRDPDFERAYQSMAEKTHEILIKGRTDG